VVSEVVDTDTAVRCGLCPDRHPSRAPRFLGRAWIEEGHVVFAHFNKISRRLKEEVGFDKRVSLRDLYSTGLVGNLPPTITPSFQIRCDGCGGHITLTLEKLRPWLGHSEVRVGANGDVTPVGPPCRSSAS
jgi:hypothetical protein